MYDNSSVITQFEKVLCLIDDELKTNAQVEQWKHIQDVYSEALSSVKSNSYATLKRTCRFFSEFRSDSDSEIYRSMCEAERLVDDLFNGLICDYIKKNNQLPENKLEAAIQKLYKQKDVYKEFIEFILNDTYKQDDSAIKVQGYTAKKIADETKLTPLGVFNYLIYLREKPQEALENLKKGLPIKDSIPPWGKPPTGGNNPIEREKQPLSEKEEIQSEGALPVDESSPESGGEPEKQPNDTNTAVLEEKLAETLKALAALQTSFDDKIAEDQHKNQLFDNMHRELTKYQNGLLDKVINTMAMDIIQFVDSVKKNLGIYGEKEPNEENYGKLLKVVSGVAEDLDDILYRQNIEPYTVPGDDVDVRRQKIIQTIETDKEAKDNKVAVRVAPGYEKDGKVLRQEIIKIYKFKSENNNIKGE